MLYGRKIDKLIGEMEQVFDVIHRKDSVSIIIEAGRGIHFHRFVSACNGKLIVNVSMGGCTVKYRTQDELIRKIMDFVIN